MRNVVFDAFALLAWLKGEPGSDYVASLVGEVEDGRRWGGVCSVNLGEVFYITVRERGCATAQLHHGFLLALPWEVIPASNELVWEAARLKASYAISYADAFALATAKAHEADLVTGDRELHAAPHGVKITWPR